MNNSEKTEEKIYGPYTRKDGRQVVIVVNNHQKRTVSYPKFLVEKHIGRELNPFNETVDHIDGNFLNNNLENLRIVSKSQHSKDDAFVLSPIENQRCKWCRKEILTDQKKTRRLKQNQDRGKAGPFCSKQCSGKYGAELQNERISRILPDIEFSKQRRTKDATSNLEEFRKAS